MTSDRTGYQPVIRVVVSLTVFALLAFGSASSRAADILELLKTHKIVVGEWCLGIDPRSKKACEPPPVNARSEIRLVNDLLIHRFLETKTGLIYPLNREDDILTHPLMKDFYRRQSLKYRYAKAQATVSGDTLVLTKKVGFGSNQLIHHTTIDTITIKDKLCVVAQDNSSRHSTGTWRDPKSRARCELVPLEASAEVSAGQKVRTLSFTRLKGGALGRENYSFTLLNDLLHYKVQYCSDYSHLTVQFNWRGGALKGTHRCESDVLGLVSQNTLSYSSLTKVDGNVRHFTASGTHKSKGYVKESISFDLDIRIVLEGERCRLEKFHLRRRGGRSGSPEIYSADSESECSLN